MNDGSFAQIDGTLIDLLELGPETRLSLRNGGEVLVVDVPQDAVDWTVGAAMVGSVLRVCGVSLVNSDERGRYTGVSVLASSTDDIKLLAAPS